VLKYGYGYDDRDPEEKFLDFMEELHHNYKEETPKEASERLLDDWAFLKSLT
jgi:hypothetical protein